MLSSSKYVGICCTYKIKEEDLRAGHPLDIHPAGHKGHGVGGHAGVVEVDDSRRVHVCGVEGGPELVPVLILEISRRCDPVKGVGRP
jgi:hypothetical protein